MKIYLVMRKTKMGLIADKAFRSDKSANNYAQEQIKINKADSLGKLFIITTDLED